MAFRPTSVPPPFAYYRNTSFDKLVISIPNFRIFLLGHVFLILNKSNEYISAKPGQGYLGKNCKHRHRSYKEVKFSPKEEETIEEKRAAADVISPEFTAGLK